MANDDFLTLNPSLWASLKLFPTCTALPDPLPSNQDEKQVKTQTFWLSSTQTTNEWLWRNK